MLLYKTASVTVQFYEKIYPMRASDFQSLPVAFLSCFGKKGSKEVDSGEALTVKSIGLSSLSQPVTPISSRPPLRTPPGPFASVKNPENQCIRMEMRK